MRHRNYDTTSAQERRYVDVLVGDLQVGALTI
jgi:hypothetical protein